MNKLQEEIFSSFMSEVKNIGRIECKYIVNRILDSEKERTIDWARDYNRECMKIYGTNKHGISFEDLEKFINK